MLRIRTISSTNTDRSHLLDVDDRRMSMVAFCKRPTTRLHNPNRMSEDIYGCRPKLGCHDFRLLQDYARSAAPFAGGPIWEPFRRTGGLSPL